MSIAYLAYHKEWEHGPFSGGNFYTDKVIPVGAICFIVSGIKPHLSGRVSYKLEGKYQVEKVNLNSSGSYGKKYQLILKCMASPGKQLDLDGMASFNKKQFHNSFTSNQGMREIKGSQAYLVSFFDQLLNSDEDFDYLEKIEDFAEIDADSGLAETEKEELKKARIGQGLFRRNTTVFWGGNEKCAVTGLQIPALLNASHITPWRKCVSKDQRLEGYNGILLCVHLDRLFDRFLIGFQNTADQDVLSLVCSPKLKEQFPTLAQIGITKSLKLDLTMVKFSGRNVLETNLKNHLNAVLARK